jgi:hypothetical protein
MPPVIFPLIQTRLDYGHMDIIAVAWVENSCSIEKKSNFAALIFGIRPQSSFLWRSCIIALAIGLRELLQRI